MKMIENDVFMVYNDSVNLKYVIMDNYGYNFTCPV